MPNVLVKPQAERDGNLVVLADNTSSISLVDLATGEIIETGRNTGRSNGRDSTIRFSRPGGAYRNVGLMDDKGNIILTVPSAGDRVQFNYNDYNALIRRPPSTIDGVTWDNSANIQAQAQGQVSNAEIANLSSEEYIEYLNSQADSQAVETEEPSTSQGLPLAALAAVPEVIDSVGGLGSLAQEAQVLTGIAEGPLTETQSFLGGGTGFIPAAAGVATAGVNTVDAFNNIKDGDTKGQIEGATNVLGTTLGAIFGGGAGAGVGSIAGRTVGRGLASIADSAGLVRETSKDIMEKRIRALEDRGVALPEFVLNNPNQLGASKEELIAREQEKFNQTGGRVGNPTFAASRNESDLRTTDTEGGLMWFELLGNDYLQRLTPQQRTQLNQAALDQGLISESRGQLFFTDEAKAQELVNNTLNQPQSQQTPSEAPQQLQVINPASPDTSGINLRNALQNDAEAPEEAFQFVSGGGGGSAADDLARQQLALSLLGNSSSQQLGSQLVSNELLAPPGESRSQIGLSQLATAFGG